MELNSREDRAIKASTILIASREQVSCDIEGETVVLSLTSSVYYGLDPIATRIWELFKQPQQIAKVCELLVTEFDVEPHTCLSDTVVLCEQLVEWGLLAVVPPS